MNIKQITLLLAIATSANTYNNDNQKNIREMLKEEATKMQQGSTYIRKEAIETFQSEGLTLKNILMGPAILEMKRDIATHVEYGADFLMSICNCMDKRNSYTMDDAYSCNEESREHADRMSHNLQHAKLAHRSIKEYLDHISAENQAQKK